jgi:hypothetical protein
LLGLDGQSLDDRERSIGVEERLLQLDRPPVEVEKLALEVEV